MRTGIIRFNVRERGRRFRGVERNFDTVALAALLNGGSVQERVRNGDMHGYFGHWPRELFGMNPVEGGIHQGKQITLETALKLRSLRADPDGTIEYEVEFNDNPPGKIAYRLWKSKRGGFSTAIDCLPERRNGLDVPIRFYGLDYVYEPNYTTNRGYTLDSVGNAPESERMALMLDSVGTELQAVVNVLDGDYQALQGELARISQALVRSQEENNSLLGMLAKRGGTTAALDSVRDFVRPSRTGGAGDDIANLINNFDSVPLEGFEPLPATAEQRQQVQTLQDTADAMLERFR